MGVCKRSRRLYMASMVSIHDHYIDVHQQKITIVGSADPEKIVKAIKKTRKSAIVCSHIEQADPPTEPEESVPAENEAPTPESSNPPTETPPAEEPPKEPPKDPPTQENQPAEEKQTHEGADNTKSQSDQPSKPRDVEEVHVIYHYPPDYGYRYNFSQGMSSHEPHRDPGYRYNYGQNVIHEPPRDHRYSRYNYGQSMSQEPPRDHGYNRYNYGQTMSYEPPRDHGYRYNYGHSMIHEPPQGDSGFRNNHARPIGPEFRPEVPPPGQPPVHVTHSYNSYQPSPYVTGYEHIRSPPRYTQYTRPDHYSEDYHYGNNGYGTISSVFSDENPNACTIA
ncbi:early nodule-specific protein 2-like isoform X2 [Lycium ferocissimum]|uniref:early nodule-specific protein 2-like isoform X2 n=1 Tax=Lycium ferocissimum TaxID=112874 RepID=UPI002815C7D0|nr:early nodule-specific protein 2-like isoform X2 [Lycium ferocissimum]